MNYRYKAFCVRCQADRGIISVRKIKLNNGALAIKGNCSVCSSSAYRIISAKERRSWSPLKSFLMGIIVSSVATLGFIALGHYGIGKSLSQAINTISYLQPKN